TPRTTIRPRAHTQLSVSPFDFLQKPFQEPRYQARDRATDDDVDDHQVCSPPFDSRGAARRVWFHVSESDRRRVGADRDRGLTYLVEVGARPFFVDVVGVGVGPDGGDLCGVAGDDEGRPARAAPRQLDLLEAVLQVTASGKDDG